MTEDQCRWQRGYGGTGTSPAGNLVRRSQCFMVARLNFIAIKTFHLDYDIDSPFLNLYSIVVLEKVVVSIVKGTGERPPRRVQLKTEVRMKR